MQKFELVTDYMIEDEPCFHLSELDKTPPKGDRRRYRTFWVVRNDELAKHVEDMGLAKDQVTDECRIMGGTIEDNDRIHIYHTVGELREIADKLRLKPLFDKRELAQVDNFNT